MIAAAGFLNYEGKSSPKLNLDASKVEGKIDRPSREVSVGSSADMYPRSWASRTRTIYIIEI
jgi:hypothetical protein